MVAESRTTATKTTVAMMTLELELDVATSSEKKEIIINIYFKTLNGEYTPFAYKKKQREIAIVSTIKWLPCSTGATVGQDDTPWAKASGSEIICRLT